MMDPFCETTANYIIGGKTMIIYMAYVSLRALRKIPRIDTFHKRIKSLFREFARDINYVYTSLKHWRVKS